MHPDSPIMEVYSITRLGENRQFVLTSTVGWRVRKSIGKSWNIHPFGDTSFLRYILEMPILEICFSRKQQVNKLNNLPLNDLSIRNQPGCCNFLIFHFFIWKSYREGNQCCFAVAPVPSVDSLAVPWIAAFRESHTNANVPVRKSLEIYLQFWNPWCSSKNAAICRVSKTSIAQIFSAFPKSNSSGLPAPFVRRP